MNLTERAEIRKETYYKLTNSRDVPEAPSVGGRNLFKGSREFSGSWLNAGSGVYAEDYQGVKIFKKQNIWGGYSQYFDAKVGEEYVFSAYVKSSAKTDRITFYLNHSLKQPIAGGAVSFDSADGRDAVTFDLTDKYKRIAIKIKITNGGWMMPRLERYNTDAYLFFGGYKFEKGSKPTPYTPAPEDYGWSKDPLVPTQSNRYLWKFEYIYYSDGSVEVTQPTNISIAGVNGQTSHVHFAFADNATGGGFSLTTPKAYMGWYADFNEAASTDPTKYRWSKWKGDQGLPGKPGVDGKTSYFHMAYADSADGRTGFSFKESGQQYQGYYTDFTQTSSTDPSKYTWMDRRAGVKVGGKNLLLHTADPWKAPNDYYQFNGVTKTDEMLNGSIVYKTHIAWASLRSNWGKQLIDRKNVKVGDEFTYSIYARTDQETPIKARLFFRYSGQSNAEDMTGEKLITQEWQRFTKTFTVTQKMLSDSSKLSWVAFEQVKNSEDGKFVYYACNMLEEGNVPTPWTQALEDIQSDIDSKADQTLTQEQLNALEAKRLQMETEMKALATLQQVSELETFINNLKKEDLDGRQKIIEITKAIEERVKDIEPIMEYSQKLKFMDTYITQGNGGMVIGANESTTKVVVTPDRISFQSGGSEVAYISQRMLHIDNGVFTMSLQLGHYITRAHPKNEYVNATYFVK